MHDIHWTLPLSLKQVVQDPGQGKHKLPRTGSTENIYVELHIFAENSAAVSHQFLLKVKVWVELTMQSFYLRTKTFWLVKLKAHLAAPVGQAIHSSFQV